MARDGATGPEAEPLRLFVAVDVPHEQLASLDSMIAPLRETHAAAWWVPLGNMHVTLRFLGSTEPSMLGWVGDRVRVVASEQESFWTRLSGFGAFPGRRRARVLWAGLEDLDGRLAQIATALDAVFATRFAPEERTFTPHLTLARFVPPAVFREELVAPPAAAEPFLVDRLVLYRSHLRRPAPVYEAVLHAPLSDA